MLQVKGLHFSFLEVSFVLVAGLWQCRGIRDRVYPGQLTNVHN